MQEYTTTAYKVAERFIGLKEVPGTQDNPQILAMLGLDANWPEHDETPWCSAFANYIAWLLRLPRSKDLRARSWLRVGQVIEAPEVGFDIVILTRAGASKDPTVIDAPGHVGFFAGLSDFKIALLGGNQGDQVSVGMFSQTDVLGYRRLWP